MATPAIQRADGPPGPIRLSPLEDMFCRAYERFDGDGMGAMVIQLRGRVEEAPLRAALGSLQQRHPRLRARIAGAADGRRYFHVVDPPPLVPVEIVDCDAGALPWREETARRFSQKMDLAAGPLVRVLVLRGRAGESCAVLLAHHAVFDGLSFLHAVDDLLHFYAEAEERGASAPVASLPFVSCPRARTTGGLLGRLGVLAGQVRMRRAKLRKSWTPLPEVEPPPSPPQWHVEVFPVEDTVSLVRRCRREKASLEGALFAAAVGALADALAHPQARFTFFFPIDIRAQLASAHGPVGPGDLGCFVSAFERMYAVEPRRPFWDRARGFHQDVRAFMAAGGPSFLYNLLRFARPRPSPNGHQRGTLNASVIGVAPLEKRYGSLAVEECAQVYKHDVRGTSINLVAIIVQLRLNLTLHAAGLQPEFWDRFRAGLLDQLRRAVADGVA